MTCVRYGNMEIVSGDRKGRIFIWLVKTGEILRKCQVHQGQVKAIQFDATRIVSGGGDGNVCITDIGTGSVIQTLRGHVGLVLSLCFDTQRIISIARDNKLYYWQWGKKEDGPPDKYHVLDKGQNLVQVSKLYNVDVPLIMKWNGILEMRMCVPGMKLLVGKGDPTKLTPAEELAVERERRRQVGLAYSKKTMKNVRKDRGSSLDIEYDRVYRKATDLDQHSLGNRLFGKEKETAELFPDSVNVSVDPNSLGSRLVRNGKEKLSLHARTRGQANNTFITDDNEEEWGPVADSLAIAMFDMLVEYEIYDVLLEAKRVNRDPQSVLGRLYNPGTLATKEKIQEQEIRRRKRHMDQKMKREEELKRKKKKKKKKKKKGALSEETGDSGVSDTENDYDSSVEQKIVKQDENYDEKSPEPLRSNSAPSPDRTKKVVRFEELKNEVGGDVTNDNTVLGSNNGSVSLPPISGLNGRSSSK